MDRINRQMFVAVSIGKKDEFLDTARSVLSPFFADTQALSNYATPFQLISAYNIIRSYTCLNDHIFREGLFSVLNLYRQTYKVSPEKTLIIIDSDRHEFLQKESFMHTRKGSLIYSRKDIPGDLYSAVPLIIDCIDKTIEFSIQHIVFELFALWNLVHSEDAAPKDEVSFGTAVRTLSSDPKLANLFQIGSKKVYIHDWRNIGAHTTYEIHCNNVNCTYKNGKETMCLTVDKLYECYWEVKRTSNIINIAKYIFEVEHTSELAALINPHSLEAATGMFLKNIQTDLLNDGFLLDPILSQDGPGGIPVVFVQDILDIPDEIKRSDAASAYLVNICRVYKMNVGIIYCDRNWTPRQYIRFAAESVDGVLEYHSDLKVSISVNPINNDI
ncbi:hypothetical protein OBV_30030 [Oscillibacter valericigenes Sjm18-20]|nr:hypothetical protein OBV_30030 [Oscillibacter valericigenes Sjm18-20]